MNPQRPNDEMSLIVKTVCRWMKAFILLYGVQIILYGHLTPGGGFAGGVVAASAFVLIMLAEGQSVAVQTLSQKVASKGECVGVLMFLLLACWGLVAAGNFFVNFWSTPESARFTLFSSGMIPLCNLGIGLKVCCSLYLVFFVMSVALRTDDDKGEDS